MATVTRTKYLLPCTCGRQVKVDASQAGLTVACRCGAQLEVPTLRGLKQLEQVDDAPRHVSRGGEGWGPRQAMILGGLLLVGLSLAGGGYLYATLPAEPIEPEFAINRELLQKQVESMNLSQTFALWTHMVKNGLDPKPHAAIRNYKAQKKQYEAIMRSRRHWAIADATVGAVGLLIAISGMLRRSPKAGS